MANARALNRALQKLVDSDILSHADATGIKDMLKEKEKERKRKIAAVLSKHLNKHGKPYSIKRIKYQLRGVVTEKWTTRAPWRGQDAKVMKNTYEEVIDELYAHYFPSEPSLDLLTLSEVFELWYEDKRETGIVSSLTLEHYRADWNRYFCGLSSKKSVLSYKRCPLLEKPIRKIKAHEIRALYESLTGDGSKLTKKCFYNLRGLIVGAFAYAFNLGIDCIDAGRVSYDSLYFKEPKDNSSEVYTPEEREKLLSYLESLPDQDCYTLSVRLMFTLCIRIGELRALTWDDIDYSNPNQPYINICHQIVDKAVDGVHRKAVDVDHMKSRSKAGKRKFPLSEYAVQVLEELHKLNPDGKYICSNKGGKNPIYTNKFNEHLKKYCEAAGVPYRSSHKIRFYAVSQMYDMGMAEKDIMALAGHSNVSTTRHYNRRLKEISMSDAQLKAGFGR